MNVTTVLEIVGGKDERYLSGFREDCRLRNLTPRTIREYESWLRIIGAYVHGLNTSLSQLDKDALKKVLTYLSTERHLSTKTLGNYFSALSTFFNYLVFESSINRNPVPSFRKRYLRQYKTPNHPRSKRKLISIKEMTVLITSILNPRDKAIVTLLAKTGIRRNELIQINLDDINWVDQSIQLKPHPKRSNCNARAR